MKYVLEQEQMKKIDEYSINTTGIPSMVLMERAALGVAQVVMEHFDSVKKVLCVCGTGNNGADGIAVARILAENGYQAGICVVGNEEKATVEWKQQKSIAEKLNMSFVTLEELNAYDVIVDGIFGIGLTREVTGDFSEAICQMNASNKPIISVDIPSGVHATNGQILGVAVQAEYTVTFGYHKLGLLLYPGAQNAGNVVVWNCGFDQSVVKQMEHKRFCYEPEDVSRIGNRTPSGNKGSFGKVLVIAGSKHMNGAAFFAGKAAYRSGSGLVKVLTASENELALKKMLPEAVLGFYDALDSETTEKELGWASQIVIGPGLSTEEKATELVRTVLDYVKRCPDKKVLLDADALNIIAMKQWQDDLKGCVITPHLGEMSRLCGIEISEIKKNPVEVAENFAKQMGCVLVMKDARTIVTDGENTYINVSGNDGMATGGSGDVLTGIIAGMWANGMELLDGAILGTYIHGLSGDAARNSLGAYAMTAVDIVEKIPEILK